ncbi:hypothetical protein [Radicibacter daui]|uniref:hypothetical protein n=1 Tax=Radicibacter daui TaxID=3064829 RepID=UPI004046CD76
MLYTDKFVWLHFGKTGGTTTCDILITLFPQIEGVREPYNVLQHESLSALKTRTGIDLSDRDVFLGFRRLAGWAVSHLHHQFGQEVPREMIERTAAGELVFADESAARKIGLFEGITTLDGILGYFLEKEPRHYLRLEHLGQDLYAAVKDHVKVRPEQVQGMAGGALNRGKYNRRVPTLTEGEITELYRNCPRWAGLEARLYDPAEARGAA